MSSSVLELDTWAEPSCIYLNTQTRDRSEWGASPLVDVSRLVAYKLR